MANIAAIVHRNIPSRLGIFGRPFSVSKDLRSQTDEDLFREFTTPEGLPRIAGRPFLPGSEGKPMPMNLRMSDSDFPFCIEMSGTKNKSLEELTEDARSMLKKMVPLHGAVLLRGLPIENGEAFGKFNKLLRYNPMKYASGVALREEAGENVMTASRDSGCYTIECHNEMSYSKKWPTYLMFFAETPPKPLCGGEPVLADVRKIKRELDSEVVAKFKRLGVRTSHLFPHKDNTDYLSWQQSSQTESQSAAEELLSASGFQYQWTEDKALRYWRNTPATRFHHQTGEEVWFNQVHAMHATALHAHPDWGTRLLPPDDNQIHHTYYGDGSDVEPEVLQHIRDVTWRNAVGVKLQKGDIFCLDNMFIQHGRLGFVGERRLLVSLTDSEL